MRTSAASTEEGSNWITLSWRLSLKQRVRTTHPMLRLFRRPERVQRVCLDGLRCDCPSLRGSRRRKDIFVFQVRQVFFATHSIGSEDRFAIRRVANDSLRRGLRAAFFFGLMAGGAKSKRTGKARAAPVVSVGLTSSDTCTNRNP
jgi:hypothetical protein